VGTNPRLADAELACLTCKEPIREGAKKCKTCDSYQDWRRHLQISSSVLALLVALVSVLSFAAPIAADLMQEDGSKATISLQTVQGGNVYFMASNAGNRPAGVGNATLTVRYGNETTRLPLYRTGEPPFIPPGGSQQLAYTLSEDQRQMIPSMFVRQRNLKGGSKPDTSGEVRLIVEAIEFDGVKRVNESSIGLDELLAGLAYMDPRCSNAQARLQSGRLSQAESQFIQANCRI